MCGGGGGGGLGVGRAACTPLVSSPPLLPTPPPSPHRSVLQTIASFSHFLSSITCSTLVCCPLHLIVTFSARARALSEGVVCARAHVRACVCARVCVRKCLVGVAGVAGVGWARRGCMHIPIVFSPHAPPPLHPPTYPPTHPLSLHPTPP